MAFCVGRSKDRLKGKIREVQRKKNHNSLIIKLLHQLQFVISTIVENKRNKG